MILLNKIEHTYNAQNKIVQANTAHFAFVTTCYLLNTQNNTYAFMSKHCFIYDM